MNWEDAIKHQREVLVKAGLCPDDVELAMDPLLTFHAHMVENATGGCAGVATSTTGRWYCGRCNKWHEEGEELDDAGWDADDVPMDV